MAVPGQTIKITYICNGSLVDFTIPFQYLKVGEVKIERLEKATGLTETLQYGTDYAVSGSTATTVLTYPALDKLTVYRETTRDQGTVLEENGKISSKVIETDFDKGIMIDQEQGGVWDRTLRAPISDGPIAELPSIARRALNLLSFDVNGDPTPVVGVSEIPISAAMEPVVTAATLSDARDEMGVTDEIDDLAGTGRTTETIKGNTDDIATNDTELADHELRITTLEIAPYQPGFIYGLETSAGTDPLTDVLVSAGKCRDYADTANIQLSTAMEKQLDATWAVGTLAGGLFTGAAAANTTYHLFLIQKDSDGTIDAGWDTDIDCANIPTGYTAYRRIRSYRTIVINATLPVTIDRGNGRFDIYTPVNAITLWGTTISTSAQLLTLNTIPSGRSFTVGVDLAIRENDNNCGVNVYSTDCAPGAPLDYTTNLKVSNAANSAVNQVNSFQVVSDSSAQVYVIGTGTNLDSFSLYPQYWIDDRGQYGGK